MTTNENAYKSNWRDALAWWIMSKALEWVATPEYKVYVEGSVNLGQHTLEKAEERLSKGWPEEDQYWPFAKEQIEEWSKDNG